LIARYPWRLILLNAMDRGQQSTVSINLGNLFLHFNPPLTLPFTEGGMAALRVLELLTGFWISPRILELLLKSPLKRVLLNRKLKKMVCYPFFTVFI